MSISSHHYLGILPSPFTIQILKADEMPQLQNLEISEPMASPLSPSKSQPPRKVDFRFIRDDWNRDEKKVRGELWSVEKVELRIKVLDGFVRGLWVADVDGKGE